MKKIEVTELTQGDLAQWDALVDNSPHGTVFHKSGWLNTCALSLGKKVKIFGCFHDGQLIGGASLFLETKWGLFTRAHSWCMTAPYGGFILSPPPGKSVHKKESFSRDIIGSLLQAIEREHYLYVSIQNSPEFLDIRPFTWNGWDSRVSYAYYINLNNYHEANLDASVKRYIRKAEKNRITIEPYTEISKYYDLYCETYTRKNLKPPAPKSLFTGLYSFIRDNECGEMIAARTPDGDVAVAEIVVWDNRQAYSWTGVSDSRFLNSGASSLIMNDYLKRLRDRGIPKINIMMANIPQLSSFASYFNPILVPHFEIRRRVVDSVLAMKNNRFLMMIPWMLLIFPMVFYETAVSSVIDQFGSCLEFWISGMTKTITLM
jgi:hypothetical protein